LMCTHQVHVELPITLPPSLRHERGEAGGRTIKLPAECPGCSFPRSSARTGEQCAVQRTARDRSDSASGTPPAALPSPSKRPRAAVVGLVDGRSPELLDDLRLTREVTFEGMPPRDVPRTRGNTCGGASLRISFRATDFGPVAGEPLPSKVSAHAAEE
jgi:hypothetical protein